MTIDKITNPSKASVTNNKINEIIDANNGYATSFTTDELNASVIKGDSIITMTSDTTNNQGVIVVTPSAFTYKGSDNTVRDVNFKDDAYYKAGDTFSISGYYAQVAGCVTSTHTTLQFNIPFPKKIPSNLTVTLNSLTVSARSGSGGYIVAGKTLTDFDSAAVLYQNDSDVWIMLTSTSLLGTVNNLACSVALSNIDISFSTV